MASSSSSSSSKLKIAGAWSGALDVQLDSWTLSMLRDEVSRRSGAAGGCTVNLICGGKVLKEGDGGLPLAELGLKNNSKVLATVVSPDKGKALNDQLALEAERSQTLTRLKAAAVALVERHAEGTLPVEDFNIELEDQNGRKLQLGSETDQRGAMMGVMLHTNGKSLIEKEKYKDALDVLSMAEESFSLCDPKLIEMIDNFPILQLDIVWCYFMLRDISCLSVAGVRLVKARKGFERINGKDSSGLRGRHQELAIYLRLELLEGVVAYYSGNPKGAKEALYSAQSKFNQLQVADEALSQLMNMGYHVKAAKRALRMTGQDIEGAVEFLLEERAKKIRRHEEDRKRQEEIMEQKRYGTTPMKRPIDINKLNELFSIGFERELAAEALKVNENDTQAALDLLTDPNQNCKLQSKIELRKQAKAQRLVEELQTASEEGSSEAAAAAAALLASVERQTVPGVGSSDAAVAALLASDIEMDEMNEMNERDVEMENELVKKLKGDPLADYDIDVTKEGEAIAEYMSLLDSPAQLSHGSSL